MRLTRIVPRTADDLTRVLLEDAGSLSPGLRVFATRVPVPGLGTIDHLATDDRGRLVVLFVCLRLDEAEVCRAVDQWDWLRGHLPTLRALGTMGSLEGVDLSSDPRVLLAAAEVSGGALRLAGRLSGPALEISRVTFFADGDRMVPLVEPAEVPAFSSGSSAEESLDPVLGELPAGEARSLMRRMIEELHEVEVGGEPVRALAVEAGVDLVAGNDAIGSLRAGHNGVRVRRFESAAEVEVQDDAECRQAVSFLLETRSESVVEDPSQAPEPGIRVVPVEPGEPGRGAAAPRRATPAPVALTNEEIAEFRRLSDSKGRSEEASTERPAIGAPPRRFVEN